MVGFCHGGNVLGNHDDDDGDDDDDGGDLLCFAFSLCYKCNIVCRVLK